jgi:hypothetical protein
MNNSKVGFIIILGFITACLAIAEEVELKFVVKPSEIPDALRVFTQGKQGEVRDVYFLETEDMALSRESIILRLREELGKRDDSTVKIRGRGAWELPDAEFPLVKNEKEESKLEKDKVIGGEEARSFSITVKQSKGEIADLRKGKRKLKELFSDKQERFIRKYVPNIDWHSLRLLGPVQTEKWKLKADRFSHELIAELWHLPHCEQKEILEFSTKVEKSSAKSAERDLLELMRKQEVVPSIAPEAKTRSVLKCLLEQLRTRVRSALSSLD